MHPLTLLSFVTRGSDLLVVVAGRCTAENLLPTTYLAGRRIRTAKRRVISNLGICRFALSTDLNCARTWRGRALFFSNYIYIYIGIRLASSEISRIFVALGGHLLKSRSSSTSMLCPFSFDIGNSNRSMKYVELCSWVKI